MPTSTEFEAAAAALFRASEETGELVGVCRPFLGSTTIKGGELGVLVETTLDTTDAQLQHTVISLDALANKCLHRAAVCEAYAASLRTYDAEVREWRTAKENVGPGEPVPRRPERPNPSQPWIN